MFAASDKVCWRDRGREGEGEEEEEVERGRERERRRRRWMSLLWSRVKSVDVTSRAATMGPFLSQVKSPLKLFLNT